MIPSSLSQSLSDRYRIDREVGRGGMATIYLAEDLKHGRQVAIKVMLPEMAAVIGHDRFLLEIETAARLTHPHILPLHDSGEAEGQLYYVMPYIEGESLRDRLEREGPLPLDSALRLTREISSALSYAHHRGVVHRDIKPENILLAEGIAMVADFGIARAVSSASDRNATEMISGGGLVGTPGYMAPEQAGGGAVDGRTDLYALACILYEMLTGEPPFRSDNPQSLIQQHLTAAPRPVTDLRQVPAGVAAFVNRGLAKVPADRFPNAAAFAEALSLAVTIGATTSSATGAETTAVPNNLPPQRTRFIGRESELAECAQLLNETSLLTLTGIGGSGKTRLALKLAGTLLDTYPDGAWFVDLAPVTQSDRVILAAAKAMNIGFQPGISLMDTVVDHLAGRHLLIVLDNCEHVLTDAADLAEGLLGASPGIKIIATSREGLGVAGERPVSLRSLGVPKADASRSLEAIESSEAVRLFVDRAKVVVPEFALTENTAPVVAEIVRRLDGIPLALELAAARVKILSVEQIHEKLDDRFRLLSGGSRSLPRHQTLRATVQWSFDQLDDEEQQLFRLLSVFGGGWTLEAAAAVAGPDTDEFEIMDILSRLVDKSMVTTERTESGSSRYGMLETVRQYAQERLDETGEGDGIRTRHLDYFLTMAEEGHEGLDGPDQKPWLERFDREFENILMASAWCDRVPEGGIKGLRLAAATPRYWDTRGHLDVGLRVLEAALERPGAEARTLVRATVLQGAGVLAFRLGRYELARSHIEEDLSIARELDEKGHVAKGLNWLAHVMSAQGEQVGIPAIYEEAISLAHRTGDKAALCSALIGEGEHHRWIGDLDSAWESYAAALEVARELEDNGAICIILGNQTRVAIPHGKLDESRGMMLEVLDIIEKTGLILQLVPLLEAVAGYAVELENWEMAARFFGSVEVKNEEVGYEREPADADFLLPRMEWARNALGAEAYDIAYRAGRELDLEAALREARDWLEGTAPADRAKTEVSL